MSPKNQDPPREAPIVSRAGAMAHGCCTGYRPPVNRPTATIIALEDRRQDRYDAAPEDKPHPGDADDQ